MISGRATMFARPCPLAITAALWLVAATPARAHAQSLLAQTPDRAREHGELWVDHLLAAEDEWDTSLRYLGAPAAVFLGGLFLSAPLWTELTPAADLAWLMAGAGFMTAAIGTWATPDPYAAQLWYARTGSLGFTALGVGLLAFCVDRESNCGARPFPRHMGTAIGIVNAGMFLSAFFTWTLAPPPSPGALALAVRGLPEAQRRPRVLAFLQERERQRRLATYVGTPWGLALGASFLVFADESGKAETYTYVMGSLLLGIVVGTTLYELLRTPESERFAKGEKPEG